MNPLRERILQRLLSASSGGMRTTLPQVSDAGLFHNYAAAQQEPVASFAAKMSALRGEFFHEQNLAAAAARLKALLNSVTGSGAEQTRPALRHHSEMLAALVKQETWLAQHTMLVPPDMPNQVFAQFEVGITAVDFLVARTGSIVLTTRSAGGRRLSVLPAFHIAVAKREQLVPSFEEVYAAFPGLARSGKSSALTIITGPSRTSDIEKILVLGAHGPKRLAVILVD